MEAMLRACQLVPLLCVATFGLALSGCYLWHDGARPPVGWDAGRGSPLDAGRRPVSDAGRRPVSDGGAGLDAGEPSDAASGCAPRLPDFACTDTGNGSVPVGVPYALPIWVGGLDECFCSETLACRAAIVGPSRLELTTDICSDFLCESCSPFIEGSCMLPPLSEGEWTVTIAGRPVFELRVSDAEPGVGPVDLCMTMAQPGRFCPASWPPHPESVDQACLPYRVPAGVPIPVSITDFCLECGEVPGSCEVTRTANEIEIRPHALPPGCPIDCGMGCELAESRCVIPPLPAGRYTVHVEDLPGPLVLTVEDGIAPDPRRACVSRPED